MSTPNLTLCRAVVWDTFIHPLECVIGSPIGLVNRSAKICYCRASRDEAPREGKLRNVSQAQLRSGGPSCVETKCFSLGSRLGRELRVRSRETEARFIQRSRTQDPCVGECNQVDNASFTPKPGMFVPLCPGVNGKKMSARVRL